MLHGRLLLLPRELGHYAAFAPYRRTLYFSSTALVSGRLSALPPFAPRRHSSATQPQLSQQARRSLHVSAPRGALPVIVPLLGLLKSSAALTGVTVIVRVAATLLVFSRVSVGRYLRFSDPSSPRYMPRPPRVSWSAWRRHWETWPNGRPPNVRPLPISGRADVTSKVADEVELLRDWQETVDRAGQGLGWFMKVMKVLMWGPILSLALVLVAGLEQTPLTGRWRMVLISPAEEEVIHRALVDKGWFEAVLDLLMSPSIDANGQEVCTPPQILPDNDWRWSWVESTLRHLENGVIARHDALMADSPPSPRLYSDSGFPLPPAPSHPLHPRLRASHYLHESLPAPSDEPATTVSPLTIPHVEGPPFQLLLLENAEPNAFSYGFGGNGASGIVINTGMLDQILSAPTSADPQPASPQPQVAQQPRSLISYFIPSISSSSSASAASPPRTTPTDAQTLHLSTILAHEMSHLLLSHHLETLSATSVLIPALVNLAGDVARVMLFPLTMLFGPFVNDFVASATRPDPNGVASKVIGESCSMIQLEVEADEVALRILANSNLNPFEAARFWTPDHPPSPSHLEGLTRAFDSAGASSAGQGMLGWLRFGRSRGSHPTGEERKKAVDKELARWVKVAEEATAKAKKDEAK